MTSKEAVPPTPVRQRPHRLWSGVRRFLIVAVKAVPLTPVRIARRKR